MPKFIRLTLAIVWSAVPLCAVGQVPGTPAPLMVIRAGTLIDGVATAPRRDQAIVVKGNRIESVGPWPAKIGPGETVRIVDLSGWTVLPGLIDAHTHVFLDPEGADYDTQLLKQSLAFRAARATALAKRKVLVTATSA